jgi:SAM-dependent methyltransferase
MWDSRYSQNDYFFGAEPNDFLREQAGQIPAGPVLCIAEGQGRNAVFLAAQGYAVTAMDASSVGMERTATLAAERGVQLTTVVADLDGFAIAPAAWSGIVSIFVHLPAPLRRRVHHQVVAGLRPGGVFVLEAYTPAQLAYGTGGPSAPALLAPLAELQVELDGLSFVLAQERERDVVEGPGHTGRAAVVQILARKAE